MLLLDENLLPKLAARFENTFSYPSKLKIKHVIHVALDNESDINIWHYAETNGYSIVTKDKDYIEFSNKFGHPPKVILITTGNSRLTDQEKHLQKHSKNIEIFLADKSLALLNLD